MSGPRDEAEWLACSDPRALLRSVKGRGKSRRLRLCAVACCRRVAHLLPDERCRRALEIAEAHADRLVTGEQLRLADDENDDVIAAHAGLTTCVAAAALHAVGAVRFTADAIINQSTYPALTQAAAAQGYSRLPADEPYRSQDPRVTQAMGEEERAQAALLRDLLRNPFRPVPAAPPLSPQIASVAQAAYDERLPSRELDPVRLAVLADALEDAGCADETILAHLRSPGPHVRGCWALDLVLGRP